MSIKAISLLASHFPEGVSSNPGWNQVSMREIGNQFSQLHWIFKRFGSGGPGELAINLSEEEGSSFFFKNHPLTEFDQVVTLTTPAPSWLRVVGVWNTLTDWRLVDVLGVAKQLEVDEYPLKLSTDFVASGSGKLELVSEEIELSGDVHVAPTIRLESGCFYVEQVHANFPTEIQVPSKNERVAFKGTVDFLRTADKFPRDGTYFSCGEGRVKYRVVAQIPKAVDSIVKITRIGSGPSVKSNI